MIGSLLYGLGPGGSLQASVPRDPVLCRDQPDPDMLSGPNERKILHLWEGQKAWGKVTTILPIQTRIGQ